jgi:hypothetical protein
VAGSAAPRAGNGLGTSTTDAGAIRFVNLFCAIEFPSQFSHGSLPEVFLFVTIAPTMVMLEVRSLSYFICAAQYLLSCAVVAMQVLGKLLNLFILFWCAFPCSHRGNPLHGPLTLQTCGYGLMHLAILRVLSSLRLS